MKGMEGMRYEKCCAKCSNIIRFGKAILDLAKCILTFTTGKTRKASLFCRFGEEYSLFISWSCRHHRGELNQESENIIRIKIRENEMSQK